MTNTQLYLAVGLPTIATLIGIFVNGLLFIALNSRMTALEARMSNLETRMAGVESRLSSLEARFDIITSKIVDLDNRLNRLERS